MMYAVSIDTIFHIAPEILPLTIDGEQLETTDDHPFYEMASAPWLAVGQLQGRWTDAGELEASDLIWQADGTTGIVESLAVVAVQQRMYNLTVGGAHTFFVGRQGWFIIARPGLVNTEDFNGHRVYQRDDLIDPNFINNDGLTNLELMKKGNAPMGPDGKPINLHHMIQTKDGAIAEVSQTFHEQYTHTFHINPNSVPTGINRSQFRRSKRQYWKNRARYFE